LKTYESLRKSNRKSLPRTSLESLPRTLVEARIATGISQAELAERLGMKPQQIQRYEATSYSSASLSRVQQVARALGLKLEAQPILT
jgi:HTH-type transcriptional regulator/antitoxin HigA